MKTVFLLLFLISGLLFSQDPLNHLKEYIKIDTKEETIGGILFFKKIFEENKIEYKIIENGSKSSIIAKIEGRDKTLKPILLTHHIDCVNNASELKIYRNLMSGPCLIDDKSLGIAHLFAFLEAKKKGVKRGIYFLAVSDEEKGGKDGIGYLIKNNLIPDFAFVLGEGGSCSSATDKKLFCSISTTDKGVLWLEIEIALPSGHSGSLNDAILRDILKKIYSLPSIMSYHGKIEELQKYISWQGKAFPRERKIPLKYEEVEGQNKIFVSTTCAITSIKTDGGANLLPSKIKFTLDIRTADKENHKQVMDFLKKEFQKANFKKILELYPSKTTPEDNMYLKKILKIIENIYPDLPVGPSINPGFSDLTYLREIDIPSFGFSPFFLNYYHSATIHKENENMPVDRFYEGIEFMKKLVIALSED